MQRWCQTRRNRKTCSTPLALLRILGKLAEKRCGKNSTRFHQATLTFNFYNNRFRQTEAQQLKIYEPIADLRLHGKTILAL